MSEASPSKAFDGKARARRMPTGPGVYLMRDAEGTVLYVGKAGNLRKRVSSYFDARPKVDRIMRMVARVADIEFSLTRTEGEALLLENQWIKSHKPRYNILLRDDKSYPWLLLTTDHDFPRIAFHRGARDNKKTYLGPYPSAGSVRESINLIQKIFRVRNCEDSYFSNRSRPCLQYQIKRCTAPCVDLVSREAYAAQVQNALLFLRGQSHKVIKSLIEDMESRARSRDYEGAAMVRDQINALKGMQAQQFVSGGSSDIDIIAAVVSEGRACVQVVTFRGGRNIGQKSFYPVHTSQHDECSVLSAFLAQYYRDRKPPPQLVLSHPVEDQELLERAFSERAGRAIKLQAHPRGARRQWRDMALNNAQRALQMNLSGGSRVARQFESLQKFLDLSEPPETVECFDISHTSGSETMGACVVFNATGPVKSLYRRYALRDVTPGDDYAALKQVLERRYRRLASGEGGSEPGLILIDGGKGQLGVAMAVLADYGLGHIPVLGVAKGRSRRAGHEEWVLPSPRPSLYPGPELPASHLVQAIRDEAHRFAITAHRGRRQKQAVRSTLEEIAGIGANRRRALLTHFGGLKGVRKAGVEELSSVPGISRSLATRIFKALH
ncbi:MAG: excinuclease ABC subunit UvrC [Xanthomonadales bacterium]|nr:excinuclease ABC subunit UvrC [Xanthomonadales bacterium]